ncbi:MAG: PBP1A family penicillin-binding protein [Candidatus Rokubacteria bacterium]|nr:PBP1A family penicillin-binding protein [Candidatus Rokubacteria bacterium]
MRSRLGTALTHLRGAGFCSRTALTLAALGALAGAALVIYTAVELARFDRADARRVTFVYAAGQSLAADMNVRAIDLAGTLRRLRYVETRTRPRAPGEYRREASGWDVFVRGEPSPFRVELEGDRIGRVTRDGRPVARAALEPEVLTSATDQHGEDHLPVRLADVPQSLIHAVLAAEDHRFFEHGGLDPRGLGRAAWANLRAGKVTQGGSTITQQLVKNRLLGSQRTLGRKLREAWLAAVVEWRYPKERILEAYLNELYLGQRGPLAVRGVGTGARAYFGKEVHQLTLAEAALLAGMARAPNSYSPVLDPKRARQRRDVVLARMHELGRISAADYEAARRRPVRVQPSPPPGQSAPYFADYVRQEIEHRAGDGVVSYSRDARVLTTLDLTLQRFAETAVTRGLAGLERNWPRLKRSDAADRLQAVLIALDPASGEIRALVGGRDYQASQFNRAVLARRQPGSAFKPFVYLAALSARRGPPAFTAASFVEDSPLALDADGEPWSPRNYEGRYEGRVSVRRALEQSLNAATVRVAEEVGLWAVIDTARALGLRSPLRPVPAMALGAFEVSPLELAGAYLPLANGGLRPAGVTAVAAIDEGDGTPLALPARAPTQGLPPAEAYLMTSLLQGVLTSGTGAAARELGLAGSVAGKTGTTNDGRDAWFVGYTPTLLALVWVGFDGGEAHGLSGAQAALPIWVDFMKQALEAYPAPPFAAPAGVRLASIDVTNGRLATRFCATVAPEIFLEGTEPAPCHEHQGVSDQIVDWWRRLLDRLQR